LIVVADSSPIQYLVQLDQQHVLPKLYSQVKVPETVFRELTSKNTPSLVRTWCLNAPSWFQVTKEEDWPTLEFDLDDGEAAAIQLAIAEHADFILMDDRKAVRAALALGLNVTGTLGILASAHGDGLVDARLLFHQLVTQTNFYSTARLRQDFLDALELRESQGRK
jgi:predicted nucleic acid-binding protein